MLYVIETHGLGGSVISATPCEDGIDEAIRIISDRLTHPEEDPAATADVITERWADAVKNAEDLGGTAEQQFTIQRRLGAPRFGLVVVPS